MDDNFNEILTQQDYWGGRNIKETELHFCGLA